MEVNRACCEEGNVHQTEYRGCGSVVTVGDMNMYVTGEGERAIILINDIFGYDITNTRIFCDLVAAGGFLVVIPDVFHGEAWPISNFPPKEGYDSLVKWIHSIDFQRIRQDIYDLTLPYLRSRGVSKIGIIGHCWGAAQAMKLASDNTNFLASGGIHPSLLTPEDAANVNCPMIFCPSQNDPPIDPIKEVLDTKPFASECYYQRFDDMEHGFCGARGNRDDPNVRARMDEAIQLMINFYSRHLA